MGNRESEELYERIKKAPMELSDNDLENIWGGMNPQSTIELLTRLIQNMGIDMSTEEIANLVAQGGCTLRNLALAKTGGNKICNIIPCF